MVETLRHKEAFEYYYSLGESRTLTSVQLQYKCSNRAVSSWSKIFNWQERIQQRDIEVSKGLEKKTNNAIVNDKAHYISVVKKAMQQFEDKLEANQIPMASTQDMDRLIKLHLLLTGEATERDEQMNVVINIKGV